jgi:hypothetical protein
LQFTPQPPEGGLKAADLEWEEYSADSLESNGVKVKISFTKNKAGIRAKVTAIAKPVQVVNTNTVISDEKKGLARAAKTATVWDKETETKDKKIVGFPYKLAIIAFGIGALLGFIFFIYYKQKQNEQSKKY